MVLVLQDNQGILALDPFMLSSSIPAYFTTEMSQQMQFIQRKGKRVADKLKCHKLN